MTEGGNTVKKSRVSYRWSLRDEEEPAILSGRKKKKKNRKILCPGKQMKKCFMKKSEKLGQMQLLNF